VKISRPNDETILFESFYVVKPEYAPASHAKDVSDVFDAIKNLNASELKIKIL
jgi:hypothetical protein